MYYWRDAGGSGPGVTYRVGQGYGPRARPAPRVDLPAANRHQIGETRMAQPDPMSRLVALVAGGIPMATGPDALAKDIHAALDDIFGHRYAARSSYGKRVVLAPEVVAFAGLLHEDGPPSVAPLKAAQPEVEALRNHLRTELFPKSTGAGWSRYFTNDGL